MTTMKAFLALASALVLATLTAAAPAQALSQPTEAPCTVECVKDLAHHLYDYFGCLIFHGGTPECGCINDPNCDAAGLRTTRLLA